MIVDSMPYPVEQDSRQGAGLGPDRPGSFRRVFCAWFGCPLEDYERRAFRYGLLRHAVPLAWLIYRLRPEFFVEDMDFIREIGRTTDPKMFINELNYFYGRNVREKSWLRKYFGIRVSSDRLLKLRRKMHA